MLLLQSTFGPAPNVPLPRAQILKQLNELGLKQWVDNNVVRQGEIRETRFQVLEGHFFAQSARARGRGKRFQEACVRREERVRIANTGDGAETPPVRTPSRTPSPVLRSSTLAPEVGADEGGEQQLGGAGGESGEGGNSNALAGATTTGANQNGAALSTPPAQEEDDG